MWNCVFSTEDHRSYSKSVLHSLWLSLNLVPSNRNIVNLLLWFLVTSSLNQRWLAGWVTGKPWPMIKWTSRSFSQSTACWRTLWPKTGWGRSWEKQTAVKDRRIGAGTYGNSVQPWLPESKTWPSYQTAQHQTGTWQHSIARRADTHSFS